MKISGRALYFLSELLGVEKQDVTPEKVATLGWQQIRTVTGVGPVTLREVRDWMKDAGYVWIRHLQQWERQEQPTQPMQTDDRKPPFELTDAELDSVWQWCDANPNQQLAESYLDACVTIGRIDKHFCQAEDMRFAAIVCRDAIGIEILKFLGERPKQ
jgi:hypothetical protein